MSRWSELAARSRQRSAELRRSRRGERERRAGGEGVRRDAPPPEADRDDRGLTGRWRLGYQPTVARPSRAEPAPCQHGAAYPGRSTLTGSPPALIRVGFWNSVAPARAVLADNKVSAVFLMSDWGSDVLVVCSPLTQRDIDREDDDDQHPADNRRWLPRREVDDRRILLHVRGRLLHPGELAEHILQN